MPAAFAASHWALVKVCVKVCEPSVTVKVLSLPVPPASLIETLSKLNADFGGEAGDFDVADAAIALGIRDVVGVAGDRAVADHRDGVGVGVDHVGRTSAADAGQGIDFGLGLLAVASMRRPEPTSRFLP